MFQTYSSLKNDYNFIISGQKYYCHVEFCDFYVNQSLAGQTIAGSISICQHSFFFGKNTLFLFLLYNIVLIKVFFIR
jgi:hypothetical protein